MIRSSKLPRDTNQRAAEIVRLSTEEPQGQSTRSPISQYLSEIGKKGGQIGGKARASKLSKERRQEIASKAAKARWTQNK
jgi:hypothetical protein